MIVPFPASTSAINLLKFKRCVIQLLCLVLQRKPIQKLPIASDEYSHFCFGFPSEELKVANLAI